MPAKTGKLTRANRFELFTDERSPKKRRQRAPVVGRLRNGRSGADLLQELEDTTELWVHGARHHSAAVRAGQLLRKAREHADITQAELARELDMSQSKISDLERGVGRYGPSYEVLERVTRACGLRIVLVDADTIPQSNDSDELIVLE